MSGNSINSSNALAEAIDIYVVSTFAAEEAGATQTFPYTTDASFPPVSVGYGQALVNSTVTGAVTLPASYPVTL